MADDDDEVSRVVALAWGVAAAPQRGPKRELSHERIVEAAIEIADTEGLQAVTMQRVAQAFGFTTMALYRYVATKSELYTLMLDAAVGDEVVPVDAEDWRTGLEQLCRWLLGIYEAHPWLLEMRLSLESLLLPGQVRVADAGLRAMETLPATPEERLGLLQLLSTFVRGHARIIHDVEHGPPVSAATAGLLREVVTPARFPGLAPVVQSGVYHGADEPDTPDDVGLGDPEGFRLGLTILLDGIESAFGGRDAPPSSESVRALSPQEQLERAQSELERTVALRKATQRRANELVKAESRARTARDRAKEAAKAAAKAAAASGTKEP
ncbi:TetR/AcrR family transcriptional regulator [Georgenia alba]|uniref:TetR/AcrR family transcriptional regulator n=1 Tax=Georgenia alba TaxID=2233858 RepID=A0ABW2Q3B1_9MICO